VRIALVSTPFVAVPPPRYGGTELIVAELVDGFLREGHEVTLFATRDSRAPTGARLRARRFAEWPPDPAVEREHAAWASGEILDGDFDVVHAHVPSLLALSEVPIVYTIHHDRDEKLARLYARRPARYVAISARQRELVPEAAGAVVIHHGLSPWRHPLGDGGGYAVFLGRLAREKGVHLALDVARAAGLPLKLGGRAHPGDEDYFRTLRLDGAALQGEVGGVEKSRLLGGAAALLFPVCWEEPFGLVMIEAMLSGTPVLALPRGSVPEVVEDGVTGFVCADEEEMARRLRQIVAHGFDRRRCHARALQRWSARRMVREHLALYRTLLSRESHVRSAVP
jgi:glycosyltransferase involved in cell wall biosynthesis